MLEEEKIENKVDEAKKAEEELPPDPEAVKTEVHATLNNLVTDEIEAVDGYEEAKAVIADTHIEHKDEIIDTIDHIEDEEKEHIDELVDAEGKIPFGSEHKEEVETKEEEIIEENPEDEGFEVFVDDEETEPAVEEEFHESEEKHVCPKCGKEVCECNEHLNEALDQKEDDIIYPYVHVEDIDGNKIPSWNFAGKIALAEGLEECQIIELAKQNKYNLFVVEGYNFFRTLIAAKGVKLEDIRDEYSDFLLGNAVIYELKD